MTFLIAAAGTGGHVFPGLSVGQALVSMGVPKSEVVYAGGDRLESTVYPREGFPFLQVEIRGLKRSISLSNLALPNLVRKARNQIAESIESMSVGAVLGLGGYVTIPAALAARRTGVPFLHAEQNAVAGLANRVVARWAERSFVSFPNTSGLEHAEWVGNPVREQFWSFDRERGVIVGRRRYDLASDQPVLGMFGGSLGAGALNEAMVSMLGTWAGRPFQVVHLTGTRNIDELEGNVAAEGVTWRRVAFEDSMESFYAACDLVVARAGGGVAELLATGTPAILVPGDFGSAGHQTSNARFLADAGAAVIVAETDLAQLGEVVNRVLFDETLLSEMRQSANRIAKPDAALAIAEALRELASA